MKPKSRIVLGAVLALLCLAGAATLVTLRDIRRNDAIAKIPDRPAETPPADLAAVLRALEAGAPYEESAVENACAYVDGRWDCADFRLASLLRFLYVPDYALTEASRERIKRSLLGFRYWMTEPGRDSMCVWSENHQILFASAEYLAGKLYPDERFTNDGRSGLEHAASARERILTWLRQRWDYGFTEWYSNVYYVEDIAPLANLVDFSGDREIAAKASIVLDLLLYDVATQSHRGNFLSTSGRSYESGKKSGAGNSMRAVIEHVWGWEVNPDGRAGMEANFILVEDYQVPEVIRGIGRDMEAAVIKASVGLDVAELAREGLLGQEDRQIMMQWAMEAFTNPEVIANTVAYIDRHDMFSNAFLHDFTTVNLSLLKDLGLLPLVSRVLRPQTDGVAIQRANTYTYRTPDYLLATAQEHHPGGYYDQQHIVAASFGPGLSVFHTHPAVPEGKDGPNGGSPTYWVGGGHLPHAAQDRNVSLAVYRLPAKAGPMERKILPFTHAWFPTAAFDAFEVAGPWAFAASGTAFIAVRGIGDLELRDTGDELIQRGRDTAWVIEMAGRGEYPDFEAFKAALRSRPFSWKAGSLAYGLPDRELRLDYGKGFFLDGKRVDSDYKRFESPWAEVERKPAEMRIRHGGRELFLDFGRMIREERELAP
jgi:hypothetical protein